MNQQVDTGNYLGIKNDEYVNELYKYALTMPKDYMKLRQDVLGYLKKDFTELVYKKFYNLMLTGQNESNSRQILAIDGKDLQPQIPIHQIQSFSLSVVKTFAEICDDLMDTLMPKDFDKILHKKMAQIGANENPQI